MKITTVEEIIACLPKGRTIFPYYRDRYAALLLAWTLKERTPIAEIKRGQFAPLLRKAPVAQILELCGDGLLGEQELQMAWAEPHDQFLLTLASWGNQRRGWQQTSRPGANLVLQVNLPDSYRRALEQLFNDANVFRCYGHPAREHGVDEFFRPTLGWIRLDIDFDTDTVLIEELQSDLIRFVINGATWLRNLGHEPTRQVTRQLEFCDRLIARHGKTCAETLLSAALWFIREELGLKEVWYHTFSTGSQLKRIKDRHPPRSLYTTLPQRFCFERTRQQPEFLRRENSFKRDRRKFKDMEFYRLNLN